MYHQGTSGTRHDQVFCIFDCSERRDVCIISEAKCTYPRIHFDYEDVVVVRKSGVVPILLGVSCMRYSHSPEEAEAHYTYERKEFEDTGKDVES